MSDAFCALSVVTRYAGGNSFINSFNGRVFQTLTPAQFDAAAVALGTPVDKTNSELYPQAGREFNLDIAKLLFVDQYEHIRIGLYSLRFHPFFLLSIRLAAIMYEYKNEDLRELIRDATKPTPKVKPSAPVTTGVSKPIAQPCLPSFTAIHHVPSFARLRSGAGPT